MKDPTRAASIHQLTPPAAEHEAEDAEHEQQDAGRFGDDHHHPVSGERCRVEDQPRAQRHRRDIEVSQCEPATAHQQRVPRADGAPVQQLEDAACRVVRRAAVAQLDRATSRNSQIKGAVRQADAVIVAGKRPDRGVLGAARASRRVEVGQGVSRRPVEAAVDLRAGGQPELNLTAVLNLHRRPGSREGQRSIAGGGISSSRSQNRTVVDDRGAGDAPSAGECAASVAHRDASRPGAGTDCVDYLQSTGINQRAAGVGVGVAQNQRAGAGLGQRRAILTADNT